MKNTKKIALMLLLAVVAVGTYFVSGTYAKYTSTVTGTDTATVAKWEWTVGGSSLDLTTAKTFTFDLFASAVKEEDTTTAEAHVATDRIAPGTGGTVSVAIVNASEVDAEYTITYTVDAKGVPLEFSTNGTTWVTAENISTLNVGSATAVNRGASITVPLKWRWAFDGTTNSTSTDADDTALGIAAATSPAQPEVTATVTMTQVD